MRVDKTLALLHASNGGLLAYNLLRSQMVKMAASLKGYTASQLSFHMASVYLIHKLSGMPYICHREISRNEWQRWRSRRGSLCCRSGAPPPAA